MILLESSTFSNATHTEESLQRAITDIYNAVIDYTRLSVLKLMITKFYTTTVVVDDFPLDMEYTHLFESSKYAFSVECHVKQNH